MKSRILYAIGGGILFLGFSFTPSLSAQSCQGDEAMVKSYVQSLSGLVTTVRKEDLPTFEQDFHQQTSLTQLTLSLGAIDGLLACLDKAKSPTGTKAQSDADAARRGNYVKLKQALTLDQDGLKAAKDSKSAKSLIEKFSFAT